jgi:GH15 family glucan-1,4-alpha-glucosidase
MEKGWNDELESFIQYYGSDAVDASAPLMSLTGFTAGADPRMTATIDRIQHELTHEPHVYRYRVGKAADDGFKGDEGAFSICSFWLVEALCHAGRLEEARQNLEQMLTYANHLGLYSEEIGPRGEALGNFPQAFTHLALISACHALDQALGKADSDAR